MIKIGSLFSGIGAWEVALQELGIDYELQFFSEIDKYAEKAYSIIHNEPLEKNIGDITKVDAMKLDDIDMLVYSPPCQAFSVAGNMKGFDDKRGILFFDALRVIEAKRPKYALMENVKGLTTKKFKAEFGEMLASLSDLGYSNYHMVLNTKNYGLPQNRERVFVISMLDDKGFNKPKEVHNGLVLRDMLEDEVDEKYYLSQDKVDKLIANLNDERISKKLPKGEAYDIIGSTQNADAQGTNSRHWTYDIDSNISCLSATDYKQPKQIAIPIKNATKKGYELATENDSINISYPESKIRRGRVQKDRAGTLETGCNQGVLKVLDIPKEIINDNERQRRVYSEEGISPSILARSDNAKIIQLGLLDIKGNEQVRRVYSEEGISPSLNTMQGGGRQPMILTSSKYVNKKYNEFIAKNGYTPELFNPYNCTEIKDIAPTQLAQGGSITTSSAVLKYDGIRIRKLTPKECWRLQGFSDEMIDKCVDAGISNTQLYKMAGNSISVCVVKAIFKELFDLT